MPVDPSSSIKVACRPKPRRLDCILDALSIVRVGLHTQTEIPRLFNGSLEFFERELGRVSGLLP